jgi:hypothetical protein
MLMSAPTGADWEIIPEPGATAAQINAEVTSIAWRATSIVDTYCNQELRSTVANEELFGPGAPRVGIQQGTGNGLLIMRRWPVTEVLAIQTAPNRVFPRVWTPVPAGLYEPEHPLINLYSDTASATGPDGSMSIVMAPGYLYPGRNSTRLLVSYANGWPHTSLTQDADAGATVLNVDDVTGWTGASGFAYDGSATESLMVESVSATTPMNLPNGAGTAQSGPGTVTLVSPLAYELWATVLAAAMQATEGGIISISVQNMPGSVSTGGNGSADLATQYRDLLGPFRRIV